MHNTGDKPVIRQLQSTKSNFLKFCKVYAWQNQKKKSDIFIYTFTRNLCFKSSFKNRFHKAFLVKSIPKTIQYMHLTL